MENFDIIDEHGNPTGKIKERSEAHRDGDWHKTVHVWIINSKHELLIQKRAAHLKAHPGMWHISVAGHIIAGDDSPSTVVKESAEELGITVNPANAEYLFTVSHRCVLNNGTYISNHINDVYLLPMNLDIAKLKLQKEEVAEVQFVPFKKLEKMIGSKQINFVDHPEEFEKLFKILDERYGQKNYG